MKKTIRMSIALLLILTFNSAFVYAYYSDDSVIAFNSNPYGIEGAIAETEGEEEPPNVSIMEMDDEGLYDFTIIPETGNDTQKVIYSERNYRWGKQFTNEGVSFNNNVNFIQRGKSVVTYQDTCDKLCSDAKVVQYNMKFNVIRTYRDDADTDGPMQIFTYDYYMAMVYPETEFNRDISMYEDTGYILYHVLFDKDIDFDGLYFIAGSYPLTGSGNLRDAIGVPVRNYVTKDDLGEPLYVAIPMSDFDTEANPESIGFQLTSGWVQLTGPPTKVNWKSMGFYGFARYDKFPDKPDDDQKIWIERICVMNVDSVLDLKVNDITGDSVIISWEHSPSKIEKYRIYRNGIEIATTNVNGYIDREPLERDKIYTYTVEAVDAYGVKSPPKSVSAHVSSVDRPRDFNAEALFDESTTKPANLISWSPSHFGDPIEYILYRNGVEYKRFDNSITSFVDDNVLVDNEYTYSLKAINSSGITSIETEKIVLVAGCLDSPQNLVYSASVNSIVISWNSVQYAVSYNVYVNNEFICTTEDTSCTYDDVNAYLQYVFSVRALNKNGAYSPQVKTRPFFVSDPDMDSAKSIVVFDDNINSGKGFNINVTGNVETELNSKNSIAGSRSLLVNVPHIGYDSKAVIFTNSKGFSLSEARNSGGRLGFWIYTNGAVDYSKYNVRIGTKTTLGTTPIYTSVNLGDYISGKEDMWEYVQIPLKDFSDKGTILIKNQNTTGTMDYSAVTEIAIVNNTGLTSDNSFYLDDFKIEVGKDWDITGVFDEDGNQVNDTVKASNQKFVIQFENKMDKTSLNSSTVYLTEYKTGKSDRNLNCYGLYSSDKKYTLYLLEPMQENTNYTLSVAGAKTILNQNSLSSTISFQTDDTMPADITNTIPEINAYINTNKSGSLISAIIKFDNNPQHFAKEYGIRISYSPEHIKPNGNKAVKISGLSDNATISFEESCVNISGSLEGVSSINDIEIIIDFAIIGNGESEISVSGTFDVYNPKSEKAKAVDIIGAKTITTSKTQIGGHGGSGDSRGSSAKRENSTNPPLSTVTPIETTVEPVLSSGFSDLNELPWAAESIKWLADNSYVNGYEDGTFRPSQTLTREEFVKMISVTFDLYSETNNWTFIDVDQDAWYCEYISKAVDEGVIKGISESEFGVGQPITREDMCVILYRTATRKRLKMTTLYDAPLFSDKDEISDYALEAINILYSWGIVNGVSDKEFAPKTVVNRAMAAKAIYQMLKLKK